MQGPLGPMGPGGPVVGGEPACVVCQRTWKLVMDAHARLRAEQMKLTPSRGDAMRAIAAREEAEKGLAGPQPAPSRQPSAEADEGDAR
jgi:hypothetical protein